MDTPMVAPSAAPAPQAAPQSAPMAPQPKKGMGIIGKILIGFFGFIFIAGGLGCALGFGLTAAPTKTATEFMAKVSSGDIAAAYKMTTKDFQEATSLEDLKKFVDSYEILKGASEPTFTDRSMKDDTANVNGTIKGKNGKESPLNIDLVKEGDTWLVQMMELTAKGAADQPANSDTDSATE
jgi:hypothetical protein